MGDVDKKHYTGHRARLRKRFLNDPHNVYAYEMMELLLGYVIRRGDTKPLAKELTVDGSVFDAPAGNHCPLL